MVENLDRVLETIADALQVSTKEISIESRETDFENWDSMGTMNIMLALEEKFGLRLEPGETGQLQSIQGIVDVLTKAGKLS